MVFHTKQLKYVFCVVHGCSSDGVEQSSDGVGQSSESVGQSSDGVGQSSDVVGQSSDNVGQRDANKGKGRNEFGAGQYGEPTCEPFHPAWRGSQSRNTFNKACHTERSEAKSSVSHQVEHNRQYTTTSLAAWRGSSEPKSPEYSTVIPSGAKRSECISSYGAQQSLFHNKPCRMARLVRAVKRHYTTVIPSEVECISSGGVEQSV